MLGANVSSDDPGPNPRISIGFKPKIIPRRIQSIHYLHPFCHSLFSRFRSDCQALNLLSQALQK